MGRRGKGALVACLIFAVLRLAPFTAQAQTVRADGPSLEGSEVASRLFPQAAFSSDYTPPLNVTGAYRGTWRRRVFDTRGLASMPMLHSDEGVIVYQLRALPGSDSVVQSVQGEVVLRDGDSITDEDVRLRLDGFYVPDTGRLHGVLEPALPVHQLVAADPMDEQAVPADYRQALRMAAQEWVRMQGQSLLQGVRTAVGLRECRFRIELAVRHRPLPPPERAAGDERRVPPAGAWQALMLRQRLNAPMAAIQHAQHPLLQQQQQQQQQQAHMHGGALFSRGGGGASGVRARLRLGHQLQQLPEAWPDAAAAADARPRVLVLAGDAAAARSALPWLRGAAAALGPAAGAGALTSATAAASQQSQWRRDAQGEEGMQSGRLESHAQDLLMDGVISSDNCGAAWRVSASTIHLERYYVKAVRYSLAVTLITFVQIVLLMHQMDASATPSAASRVSVVAVSHLALMDAYLCLLHLTAALVLEALFSALATAAFFEFVIFAIFEMRFLLLVWRSQRPALGDAWSARRELSLLYTRFYAVLLAGIFLAYQLQAHVALLLGLAYSFWVPQIVHSVVQDARAPLRPTFIVGTSATRVLLPLYLFACPHNVLRIAPAPGLCAALVGWLGLQVAVLLLQHAYGPRCFVPAAWLPPKYNYFRAAVPRHSATAGSPARRVCGACQATVLAAALTASGSGAHGVGGAAARRGGGAGVCVNVLCGGEVEACGGGGGGGDDVGACTAVFVPSVGGRCPAGAGDRAGLVPDGHRRCMQAPDSASVVGMLGGDAEAAAAAAAAASTTECVICMSAVDVSTTSARMVTPCGHFFHEPCLVRWMNVKLDCPTCRASLPPL